MTYKTLKAASRLKYRVGQTGRKNDLQIDNRSHKLACKINAKHSLAFFYCVAIMMCSNRLFSKLLPNF